MEPITGTIASAQAASITAPPKPAPLLFQLKQLTEVLWRSGMITVRLPSSRCTTFTFNKDYRTGMRYPFLFME